MEKKTQKKQFAVIGLGQFGFYLATHLSKKGHEVLAIDKRANHVQEIKDVVSHAVVADATDIKALDALGVENMDAVIVCIGSSMSDSILTTLNLHDLGVKRLMAKALTDTHGRILQKIGAHEVLFPERDLAISLAERLHNPNMLDYLPFIEGYTIVQLSPPKSFLGKTLRDIDMINRYGVQIIAIKETTPEKLNIIPKAKYRIKEGDVMIILGPNDSLEKIRVSE